MKIVIKPGLKLLIGFGPPFSFELSLQFQS